MESDKVINIQEYKDGRVYEEGIGLPNSKENLDRYLLSRRKVIKLDFRRGSVLEFPVKRS